MDLNQLQVPYSIRQSAGYVMSHAGQVRINYPALEQLAEAITTRLVHGPAPAEASFGLTGDLNQDINLLFFETAVNYCFWSESKVAKWRPATPNAPAGGWYGLVEAFRAALQSGLPLTDARWMSRLSLAQAEQIFAGHGRIPLLEQRVNNLVEMADFLLDQHDGQAVGLLEACRYSAPALARELARQLPSFRDGAWYKGQWVWFLKRAQILPSDLQQLSARYSQLQIHHLDQLTAFADYKLPQVLQHAGAFIYDAQLRSAIQRGRLLPSGSEAEVEIRAATVLAVDHLATVMHRTAADVDLGLWLISQDQRDALPRHHRTVTVYY